MSMAYGPYASREDMLAKVETALAVLDRAVLERRNRIIVSLLKTAREHEKDDLLRELDRNRALIREITEQLTPP